MVLFFASHEITIYRTRRKGSSDKYGFSATFTAYPADIQPATVQRAESYGGRIGNMFQAFVNSDVDIKEGDQVVANSKRYWVKGVSRFENAGLLDHLELILEKRDG